MDQDAAEFGWVTPQFPVEDDLPIPNVAGGVDSRTAFSSSAFSSGE